MKMIFKFTLTISVLLISLTSSASDLDKLLSLINTTEQIERLNKVGLTVHAKVLLNGAKHLASQINISELSNYQQGELKKSLDLLTMIEAQDHQFLNSCEFFEKNVQQRINRFNDLIKSQDTIAAWKAIKATKAYISVNSYCKNSSFIQDNFNKEYRKFLKSTKSSKTI
jgi:hypothetical protein